MSEDVDTDPLYKIWMRIRKQCLSPSEPGWKSYGGRGIDIHPSFNDYETFADYIKNLANYDPVTKQLERRDTNGHFAPGNLRWVNQTYQNIVRTHRGKNKYTGITFANTYNKWVCRVVFKGKVFTTHTFHSEKEALEHRNHIIRKYNLPHTIQEWKD